MSYLVVIRLPNHDTVCWTLVENEQEALTMVRKINQAIEQSQRLIDDVWLRKVDQMTTGAVAKEYGFSQNQALRLLKEIASGQSGDARFVYVPDRQGVIVCDGTLFTRSRMSIDGRYGSRENEPTHYVWFCS